ncbi:MAG: hypothetical protein JWN88_2135 [Frankiales bacterium]|jgi:hypothetical protein|nr:hypothetical protein [Frankiales bacterium]
MTRSHHADSRTDEGAAFAEPDVDETLDQSLDEGPDAALHSFAVVARFRLDAATAHDAEVSVRKDLQVLGGAFSDAKVEPQEPDGRWAVDVRFVVASVDGELAVEGVHSTLREQGLEPDEAWVAERLP